MLLFPLPKGSVNTSAPPPTLLAPPPRANSHSSPSVTAPQPVFKRGVALHPQPSQWLGWAPSLPFASG